MLAAASSLAAESVYAVPDSTTSVTEPAVATPAPLPWYHGLRIRTAMEIAVPSGARDLYGTGAGFNIGIQYRAELPKSFYFEPGVELSYTTMTVKDEFNIDDYLYRGNACTTTLRIPLMVGYCAALSDFSYLDFSTGPWLNFNVSARQTVTPNLAAPVPVPNTKINLFDHGFKRFDAAWGIRLYVTFARQYTVGITSSVAFTPLASFGNRDKKIRVHRNTIAISLGYNF